jgi:transcriptional regulator
VLIHRHDDGTDDPDRWRAFVADQGFGHLVAGGRDRDLPIVVPTQFLLDGDRVLLHLAAPNPIFGALLENPHALLSIAGDWAYIPGRWKTVGDEDPRRGIPTTYYAAVQLAGPVTVHRDPDAIADLLRRQLADLDDPSGLLDPTEHAARLRTIRGVELSIEDVRAKFKYGGNVDEEHRRAVADRLRERAGPGDLAAADRIPFEQP